MHPWKYVFIVSVIGLVDIASAQLVYDEFYKQILDVSDKTHRGIFENFVKDLFTVLTGNQFSERKVKRFCRAMARYLKEMDYDYAKELGDIIGNIAEKKFEEIKDELHVYFDEYKKRHYRLVHFMQAMDAVFTDQEEKKLKDFLNELKIYGNNGKLDMGKETETLLNNVILDTILKSTQAQQYDILKKLRKLVKEFQRKFGTTMPGKGVPGPLQRFPPKFKVETSEESDR